jgi:transposase
VLYDNRKKNQADIMARYKEYDREQSLLIPVNYKDQLLPGTIEYAIDDIVNNYIDTSIFDDRYANDTHGAKAYSPTVLLKIVLQAYAKGCTRSRRIQELCETNILFIAMSANTQPDHSTIAAFVSSMKIEISTIFTDILIRCAQLDLIGGEVFALDGCKLSSNAAKEMSGTLKELSDKKEKLKTLCDSMLESHEKSDLEEKDSIEKRPEKYIKQITKIDTFLKSAEPRKGKRTGENKSNITDNESAKMKTSHVVIQGYNGLAVVDEKNQIIINAEAFGQGSEGDLHPGLVESAEKNMQLIDEQWKLNQATVVADTNYFSESNCEFLEINKIDGYIPDPQFRKSDPRFPDDYPHRKADKKNLFGHDKFIFQEESNTY